ncbi:MAG TPA: response regulator [Xanthobacteraceae bacterium]|nr:response regulator [Xanthobacteraceae bacterium]
MSGDFVSVRFLAVCASEQDGELLRQGATHAVIPAYFTHVTTVGAARAALTEGNVDIALLDSTMAEPELDRLIKAVGAARNPPAIVMLAPSSRAAADLPAGVAAIAVKPARLPDAKALIESCMRLKLPSRVLVVDDSSTVRSIVRKILSGCRFPVDTSEATDGIDALKQIGAGNFDFIFLDNNMPGLNGIDVLSQFKRQHPRMEVVMMTSAPDEALAARAQAAGAAGFLRKPFYPADVDAILYAFHGLRPPAT